jgi:hypothetical protein
MGILIRSLRWMGVVTACAAYAATGQAADVNKAPGDTKSLVVIEGTIEDGDCDKLLILVRKSSPRVVYLASPGGSVREAMRMGRLVRALKLATIAPVKRTGELRAQQAADFGVKNPNEDLMCASACFFVFVAGVLRNQDYTFGSPLLGIHRPYLSNNDLKGLSVDRTIETATRTRAIVESYLREMGVRPIYADQMFSIPREQVYWIPATQFRSDFVGLLPELKEWISVHAQEVLDRVKQTDTSKFSPDAEEFSKSLIETLSDPDRREAFVLRDLQLDAWKKLVEVSGAPSVLGPPAFLTCRETLRAAQRPLSPTAETESAAS